MRARNSILLAAILAAFPLTGQADEAALRVEIAGGICKHRLAEDSAWSYREWGDYDTNIRLDPKCYQFGFSYLPFTFKHLRWGIRAAYVDLGRLDADNSYPIDEAEYFRAKATRTPVNSETGRFQATGGSRGITLGLAAEYPVGPLRIGAEIGGAGLYSTWHLDFNHAQAVNEGCRQDWACADGWNGTWYIGMTARAEWLFVSLRQYQNVHASQRSDNPLFIGPTTGRVTQVVVGLSVPL
jgi:hypothetical protein